MQKRVGSVTHSPQPTQAALIACLDRSILAERRSNLSGPLRMRRSLSQPLLRSCARCHRTFSTVSPLSARPATTSPPTTRTRSVYYNNRFHNPWPSFKEKSFTDRLSDIRRWWAQPRRDPFNPAEYASHGFSYPYSHTERLDVDQHLPLHTPDFQRLGREGGRNEGAIAYTWIGHATSLLQLHNLTVLTDPWFSERPSAWQRVGPRRFRPPACRIDQLPPLDVIVISHSHFDHLDYTSVKALQERMAVQQRDTGRICRWYVPLGMKAWLRRWAALEDEVCTEMDWWEERTVEASSGEEDADSGVKVSEYRVTCVGAQHWTSRLAMIDNRWQLWCGFVISVPPPTFSPASSSPSSSTAASQAPMHIYYSGDTGYCSVFNEIGEHFSQIHLSLIPIGAYEPEWLLNGAHVHPRDSVRMHRDVRSQHSVAVHWGTVVLSDEMVMAPKLELERAARESGLAEDEFITTMHGRTMVLSDGKWS